jgi:hypothetical protein
MIGGKDWDKYIICEGCNKRPTLCSCKKDSRRETLIILCILIVVISGVTLLLNVL